MKYNNNYKNDGEEGKLMEIDNYENALEHKYVKAHSGLLHSIKDPY